MKKRILFNVLFAVIFGFILSSCASNHPILTREEINSPIGGLDKLEICQFFISKDVVLTYNDSTGVSGVNEKTGTVIVREESIRRTINIKDSTPGILQAYVNKDVSTYRISTSGGKQYVDLSILFDKKNDNVIEFRTLWDENEHKFELIDNKASFDGLIYTISYKGDEKPYLRYYLDASLKVDDKSRTVKGREIKKERKRFWLF